MNQRDPSVERAVEAAGLDAEDALERRVPLRDARGLVPPPGAELARGQGEHEVLVEVGRLLLQQMQLGLSVVCRSDETHDRAVLVAKRRDPREDPVDGAVFTHVGNGA